MNIEAAKCTQCGANIEVDSTQDTGICKYCNTAYITKKAIANYNNNYHAQNITIINNYTQNEKKQTYTHPLQQLFTNCPKCNFSAKKTEPYCLKCGYKLHDKN